MRNAWMAAALLLAAGCSGMAQQPDAVPPATAMPDQQACQQQGGRWTAIGRAQNGTCLVDYPDAGKACTDAAQCQGRCLLQGEHLPSGQPAKGTCQRDASERFGCRQPVENGVAGSVLCVD